VRIADWDGQGGRKVADIIVRMGPFLKLYSSYIKEFQIQCDILDDCASKYPKFGRALREFENSDRCVNLTVKHYMLKPVQRLPQYRLLLEQYLARLGPRDNDYLDASTALTIVAQVANHANDAMKHASNFVKLLSLQERLLGSASGTNSRYELVKPGRYLLREGELLKLCSRGAGMRPRYFILLSDVLLYTQYNAGGSGAGLLRLNCELPLEGMRVEIPHAQDFDNEFSIISTSRSFTLQASCPSEREGWLTALKEAIAENAFRRSSFLTASTSTFQQPQSNTLGKQAPVWIPDYRVTMCQQCTAEFTLTFRRHHCRACGKVVCDHCSANRAPLHYKRFQSARVCDNCFESLLEEFQNKNADNLERTSEKTIRRVSSIKSQFKRGIKENRSGRLKCKKRIPDRLMEVCASDAGSQMSGYLKCTIRKSWHRGWFVLKDRVLYEYRAPQDIRALQSLPILGYNVETVSKTSEVPDGVDVSQAFQLTHSNQLPFIFYADSPDLTDKWIKAMKEAVVLT